MSIATIVTHGYGNGTFNGNIPDVVTFGYTPSAAVVVEQEEAPTGGFWFRLEQERYRIEDERREIERKRRENRKIKDELERKLAEEQRKLEEEELRQRELNRLTDLAEQYESAITEKYLTATKALNRAIELRTYSAMEALERELNQARAEEMFMIQAAYLLIEAN